jgi:patatin-related protein
MSESAGNTAALLREVRLGLVCYGGVSLAIYMHGVTKELYKLVRAARAFENAYDGLGGQVPADEDPGRWLSGPGLDTERAYFAALAALSARGTPLTVTLDIIAGTSAGGINGVCLARGLAEGRSLDGFRQLWISEADLDVLLAGPALFPWGRLKMLSKLATSVLRLPGHSQDGLLKGDVMSRLLYAALDGMQPDGGTLVPDNESLDLFVTTTSVYGYDTAIPTGAGGISQIDKSYRQLLSFHYDKTAPGQEGAGLPAGFSDVYALTFAARATASFPGAFPPVSLGTFIDSLGSQARDKDAVGQITRHFVYGLGYGATEAGQWFMDGGVLDNGPFDHVIDAIAAKRADGPTAREIIYIQPDPGPPPPPGQPAADERPTFLRTLLAARVTVPQHTPLVGVLGQLEQMNAAIAEVGAIVRAQEPYVMEWLTEDADRTRALRGDAGYDSVTGTAAQVREKARDLAGELGYTTYGRLRAQAVATDLATGLTAQLGFPAESNAADFVVAVLTAWARQQRVWDRLNPGDLEREFGDADVSFRLRRAEFLLQGISALYASLGPAAPAREPEWLRQVAAVKTATWNLITDLRALQRQAAADVSDLAAALFGPQALTQDGYLANPEDFAGTGPGGRGEQLSQLYQAFLEAVRRRGVTGSSRGLWAALSEQTGTWDPAAREALRARYVGFPIWDALIFPVVSLARLPQLTPVSVQRFSPLDATCLTAVDHDGNAKDDPCAKLDGTAWRHFGAFFAKSSRENDYLWGRLDGAELIMRLLARQAGTDPAGFTEPLRAALTAILAAEQPSLGEIGQACRALGAQIKDIKTIGPNDVN